ncbi:unnamed protein product [marine sediment metagenome]|uniref:Uncharacterized protein n=1 Tax=marine sediment metagenome TaxID=412755 RepID=X1FC27_9ZZZZ
MVRYGEKNGKKSNKEGVAEGGILLKPLNWKYAEIPIRGVTDLLMERDDGTCAEYYDKKKGKKVTREDTRLEEGKVESKIHY